MDGCRKLGNKARRRVVDNDSCAAAVITHADNPVRRNTASAPGKCRTIEARQRLGAANTGHLVSMLRDLPSSAQGQPEELAAPLFEFLVVAGFDDYHSYLGRCEG